MSSDDPSLVETKTLFKSLRHDLFEAQQLLRQAFDFIGQAHVTVNELERRAHPSNLELTAEKEGEGE